MPRKVQCNITDMSGRPIDYASHLSFGLNENMSGIKIPMNEVCNIRPYPIVIQPYPISFFEYLTDTEFGFYPINPIGYFGSRFVWRMYFNVSRTHLFFRHIMNLN